MGTRVFKRESWHWRWRGECETNAARGDGANNRRPLRNNIKRAHWRWRGTYNSISPLRIRDGKLALKTGSIGGASFVAVENRRRCLGVAGKTTTDIRGDRWFQYNP